MRRPLSVVLMAAGVVGLLAACDGDDPPADGSAPTAATDETDEVDEVDETDGPGEIEADAAERDAFCAAATEYIGLLNGPVFNGDGAPDPAQIEASVGELRAALEAMDETVPAVIDDDFDLVDDGTDEFLDQLEDAGHDPDVMTADPDFAELEAEFNRQEYLDASANLIAYVEDDCGLDVDVSTAATVAATTG